MNKLLGPLARRYGKAFFDCVALSIKNDPSSPSLEEVSTQVRTLALLLDKDLLKTVANPSLHLQEKRELLKEILNKLSANPAKVSKDLLNLIDILLENKRFECIELLLQNFLDKADEALGIARIELVSARELQGNEVEEFTNFFSTSLKKQVVLNYTVDPTLLVGFKAKVKNINIDASLHLYLTNLKASLNWGV